MWDDSINPFLFICVLCVSVMFPSWACWFPAPGSGVLPGRSPVWATCAREMSGASLCCSPQTMCWIGTSLHSGYNATYSIKYTVQYMTYILEYIYVYTSYKRPLFVAFFHQNFWPYPLLPCGADTRFYYQFKRDGPPARCTISEGPLWLLLGALGPIITINCVLNKVSLLTIKLNSVADIAGLKQHKYMNCLIK